MSKIYVDEIAGIASPSTVAIPGHVIQVVQGEYATESDTTSSSFVSTGLTATITPSSASSKILIVVALASSGAYVNGSAGAAAIYRIWDGTSTLIQTADRYNDYGNSGGFSFSNQPINYLHSPSTTSAITYRVDHRLVSGDASRVFNDVASGSKGTITLMEIAG